MWGLTPIKQNTIIFYGLGGFFYKRKKFCFVCPPPPPVSKCLILSVLSVWCNVTFMIIFVPDAAWTWETGGKMGGFTAPFFYKDRHNAAIWNWSRTFVVRSTPPPFFLCFRRWCADSLQRLSSGSDSLSYVKNVSKPSTLKTILMIFFFFKIAVYQKRLVQ